MQLADADTGRALTGTFTVTAGSISGGGAEKSRSAATAAANTGGTATISYRCRDRQPFTPPSTSRTAPRAPATSLSRATSPTMRRPAPASSSTTTPPARSPSPATSNRITSTTATAISISPDNTGATINFHWPADGLEISTTAGTGFQATGGGTINIPAPATTSPPHGPVLNWSTAFGRRQRRDLRYTHHRRTSTGGRSSRSTTSMAQQHVNGGRHHRGTSGAGHGLAIIGGSAATFNFANAAIDSTSDAIRSLDAANGAVTFTTGRHRRRSRRRHQRRRQLQHCHHQWRHDRRRATIRPESASTSTPAPATSRSAASIAKTTAGDIVEITGRTGGTVTFTGNFSATGTSPTASTSTPTPAALSISTVRSTSRPGPTPPSI